MNENCLGLPPDVVRKINLDVPMSDVQNLCRSSKRCNEIICNNDNYWRLRFEKDFWFVNEEYESYKYSNWKQHYQYNDIVRHILFLSNEELQDMLEEIIINKYNNNMSIIDDMKLNILKTSYYTLGDIANQKIEDFVWSQSFRVSKSTYEEMLKSTRNIIYVHKLSGYIKIFLNDQWIKPKPQSPLYKKCFHIFQINMSELQRKESIYGLYEYSILSKLVFNVNGRETYDITNVDLDDQRNVVIQALQLFDSTQNWDLYNGDELLYILSHLLLLTNNLWFN